MQYVVYLTNGKEESAVSILGNKERAIESCRRFVEIIKRDNAYFELREYENATTSDYKVVDYKV